MRRFLRLLGEQGTRGSSGRLVCSWRRRALVCWARRNAPSGGGVPPRRGAWKQPCVGPSVKRVGGQVTVHKLGLRGHVRAAWRLGPVRCSWQ